MIADEQRAIQLWLSSDSDRIGVAASLRGNTKIANVSIFVDGSVEQAPHEEMTTLFKAIGSLTSLQNLYVYSFGASSFDVFPVKFLTCILKQAQSLEILSLYFLEIDGSLTDFIHFENELRYHQYLREFRLESCQWSDEAADLYSPSRLLITLSTETNLERVELSGREMCSLGAMSERSLETICGAPNLRSLSLINFPLLNAHISNLEKGLKNNANITELAMSCDTKESSNLTTLMQAKTLRNFKLILDRLDDDYFIERIASSLGKSLSLKGFELKGKKKSRLNRIGQKAFVTALEKNALLERFDVAIPCKDLGLKIKLYLSLNQNKRALFQRPGATSAELVKAMAIVRNDLDCLYCFLSIKPSICQGCG